MMKEVDMKPRAVVRDAAQYGGSEIFSIQDVSPILPNILGPNDVIVKMAFTSVNPAEVKIAHGAVRFLESGGARNSGWRIPGADFSGTVTAIGANVTKVAVGDEVLGEIATSSIFSGNGTWAEEMITQEDYCLKKPSTMPSDIAGALAMVAHTSMTAIRYYMGGAGGQRVLVIGGSSGTGMMAIQIMKAHGAAFVAATCSAKNVALVQSLGADLVIDYTTQDWTIELRGKDLDVVYDCVGGRSHWYNCPKVLKPSWGKYIAVAPDDPDADVSCSLLLGMVGGSINRKFWSFFGHPGYYMVQSSPNAEYLAEVVRLHADGKLKVVIDSVHPFTTEGVRAALDKVAGRHTSGKVLIKIS